MAMYEDPELENEESTSGGNNPSFTAATILHSLVAADSVRLSGKKSGENLSKKQLALFGICFSAATMTKQRTGDDDKKRTKLKSRTQSYYQMLGRKARTLFGLFFIIRSCFCPQVLLYAHEKGS